jgi:hypothetical protein
MYASRPTEMLANIHCTSCNQKGIFATWNMLLPKAKIQKYR